MRKPVVPLVILLLFSCCSKIFSQEYLFDARHISTDDGLANLMTTTVFKDRLGFIWMSTKYGLNRYDGYTFQSYTKEKNGLRTNEVIRNIIEDKSGNLWLFYINYSSGKLKGKRKNGIDIFNLTTEKATPIDDYFEHPIPFEDTEIKFTTILDPKKRIWITTKKGQIFLYQKGVFKKVFEREGISIDFLTIDQQDNIWIGGQNQLLYISLAGEILERLETPRRIWGLWAGENNSLWLSFIEKGGNDMAVSIWSKAKGDLDFKPFVLSQNGRTLAAVKRVIRTKNGFWYANKNDRLQLFNSKGEWLFDFHTLLPERMETGFYSYLETENELWFATPAGVIKTNIESNPFHLIHSRNALSDCRSIVEDESGNIYFLDGFPYQWNPQNLELTKFSETMANIGLVYTDSMLWAGFYNGTILSHRKNSNTPQDTIYSNLVYAPNQAFLETKVKNRFLVGHDHGLSYMDTEQNIYLPFDQYNGFDQLKPANVHHFHSNEKGIWIATESGIFLMDKQKGIIKHFDKASGDLPFNNIRHIYEEENGVFWLATKGGGIIRWIEGAKQMNRQFTTKDGLSNNYTYAIYGDDYNNLWISSDKGLMCMNKTTFEVKTYLEKDGLPHNEFNLTAHHQAKDGTLYFGGLGGLIAFHPKSFADRTGHQTPLKFIGYHLLEEGAEKMAEKTELLQKPDGIIIKPSDKLFELRFALLDYGHYDDHAYAYTIDGYTNHWNHINENYIRVTHLPAGDYTLRIRGQHKRDGWSEQKLVLPIKVLKPFYLQWWFITALIATGLGFLFHTIKSREAAFQKNQKHLEKEVQNRTHQIEHDKQIIAKQAEELKKLDKAKTHFFSNITHEFRTPLTLILGPLEQIIHEPPPPTILRRRLNGVYKNAKHLLGLINQMLDLSKIESGQMKIEASRGNIVRYTRELTKRFQALAYKKELHLNFIAHQKGWETTFDKNKWDKIIYNLLSNALKFSPPGATIQLSLMAVQKDTKGFIRLDVKDSGIGIKQQQLKQIFNRFYQADSTTTRRQSGTGIGLALVKELVELQGGEIRVSSELNKGTSFEVLLPVLQTAQAKPLVNEDFRELTTIPVVERKKTILPTIEPISNQKEKLDLLIIEDNHEMRDYIRSCLDSSKYNILEACDGEQGIQKAQALIPDLIISDLMMPKKNGYEVTQAIRNNISTSHIPLILLTAKASLKSRLEGLERGADAYLIKPFSPKELALRIQKLIEVRHSLQQRYQGDVITKTNKHYEQEDEFIIKLRNYILENIDESNLTVDRIAKYFTMSRVHLYRKLKALTSESASDFIRSIRLKKAMELIEEGQLNISEISYLTGFSSPSHFSRSFKRTYGKAPSEM